MPAPSKNWVTINDGAVDSDSPVDQALMTAYRDNLVHLEEWLGLSYTAAQNHDHDGVNSASVVLANGVVTEAKLASSAVSQAKLKTSSGSVATVSGTPANLTLPGGQYGFYPRIWRDSGVGGTFEAKMGLFGGTAQTTNIYLAPDAAYIARADQLYVLGSPPYESFRANDAIPLFVFCTIHKITKELGMLYVAIDPPWADNGPTIINPLGRLQKLALQIDPQIAQLRSEISAQRAKRALYEQKLAEIYAVLKDPAMGQFIAQELAKPISQADKNADMPLIPHPFMANDLTDYQVVAINPTDDVFGRSLAARHEFLGDSIAEVLQGDYLILDNDPMPGLQTPAGVMAIRARWKLN